MILKSREHALINGLLAEVAALAAGRVDPLLFTRALLSEAVYGLVSEGRTDEEIVKFVGDDLAAYRKEQSDEVASRN